MTSFTQYVAVRSITALQDIANFVMYRENQRLRMMLDHKVRNLSITQLRDRNVNVIKR